MPRTSSRYALPHPFLKWVGGKGQLLDLLLCRVTLTEGFRVYHEPFVGGGALFFELYRQGLLREGAILSDKNPHLIETWEAVRSDVDGLVERLAAHRGLHNEAYYYQIRSELPSEPIDRATRILYLNKTCFNGLYRENRSGMFNVPIGRYTDPPILDEANLRACSAALQGVELRCQGFEEAAAQVGPEDFVYFDPPYVPVSATSNFTQYVRGGFGEQDQRRLAEVFSALSRRGASVMLTNSWAPLVLECYREFSLCPVSAARSLNSRADRRGGVQEALVDNFSARALS